MLDTFSEVWLADFEFSAPPGGRPQPHCLVAREFFTGRTLKIWADDLREMDSPPFDCGATSLLVAYFASAELGCFLELGWKMPAHVLDLFTEFRRLTNGTPVPSGNGLLGALTYFGLDAMGACVKECMRDLAIRGGPYSEDERAALIEYCEGDVTALIKLLHAMRSNIDWERALLRGRYMIAVARMESNGIPIDVPLLESLKQHWTSVQSRLIAAVNVDYGVYVPRRKITGPEPVSGVGGDDPIPMSFSVLRFEDWLARNNIPWPRLASGSPALDDETFKEMARRYTSVAPLRELRNILGQLRLNDLTVGVDGRNRCLLSPFRSRTGRNQPSNSQFIFGPSCWFRSLIRPKPGFAVAYVDWEQQEFGIAAALSGDRLMQSAYESGDPYLTFAKQAGAVPQDATKASHPTPRAHFKMCALAVQYGMGEESLAASLGEPVIVARQLLRLHHQTYPKYWEWSERAVNHAMLFGHLDTAFGWRIHVGADANPRSLANFPCQANGAEMLRLACCFMTDAGLKVCAPVHDAVLIEAPDGDIDRTVSEAQALMRQASKIVLGGFPLRTDATIVRYPDRYMDERGERVWRLMMGILQELGCGPITP